MYVVVCLFCFVLFFFRWETIRFLNKVFTTCVCYLKHSPNSYTNISHVCMHTCNVCVCVFVCVYRYAYMQYVCVCVCVCVCIGMHTCI